MNRRAFLRTGAASTAILWGLPAWCAQDESSPPSDSELLTNAKASIERHRKTDITVRVENSNGAPLPNAKVKCEQASHEFLFGCNLFQFEHCATNEQEDAYLSGFSSLFNYATLGFYWASYEFEQGKPNYDYTDRVLQWTKKQNILCKGHPLVWDHPAGSPRWLPDDPAEIARLVGERIVGIVSRFRGQIDFWDVVNEPTHLPEKPNKTKMGAWGAELGAIPYTVEPLRRARAANPNATLLVNDYRTDPPYFQLLSSLRRHKAEFPNAVGIQSHMHDGVWSLRKVYSTCEAYAQLGVPIHFTETTILSGDRKPQTKDRNRPGAQSEDTQAQRAADFYTMLFAHPAVAAITWWDFSDYHAWQAAPAGLVRSDMTPKPVYERLHELIRRQWWTNAAANTDGKGICRFRGTHGLYYVMAEGSDRRELVVGRSRSNQITLRI